MPSILRFFRRSSVASKQSKREGPESNRKAKPKKSSSAIKRDTDISIASSVTKEHDPPVFKKTTGSPSSLSSSGVRSVNSPKQQEMINLTQNWINLMNQHDLEKLHETLVSPDFYVMVGEMQLPWEPFHEEISAIHGCFPDFEFAIQDAPSMSLVDGEKGEVATKITVVPQGTHTGNPYGFGPYEALPAKGCRVQNDPEIFHFFFVESEGTIKISKMVSVPTGRLHGPQAFYTQLGGFPLV